MDGQVLGVACRHRQPMTIESHRNDAVELRHRLGEALDQFLRDRRIAERNHLHVHLFTERLRQLLVGDKGHVLGQFSEQNPWLLLLFLDQKLQLIVGDKTHVNKDLTDFTCYHWGSLPRVLSELG